MTPKACWSIAMVMLAFSTCGCAATGAAGPKETDRIVCLGDSITDGFTYGQIIMQALKEAGRPVPAVICAGAGGNTAAQMEARLDKAVLALKPTIVAYNAGANDAGRPVPAADFENTLRTISQRVKAQGATMILITPSVGKLNTSSDEKARAGAEAREKMLAVYADVMHKVAAQEGYPVAETNAMMLKARAEGKDILSADGLHPNYLGQSVMARSVLDAMGCADVPLPKEFKPKMFPGVIREWKMRLAPLDDKKQPIPLTDEAVKALAPDAAWKTYTLPDPPPDTKPTAEDWWEQERLNGFGNLVEKVMGKGPVQAVAYLDAKEPQKVFVNTGTGISTVWFNGVKIHEQGDAWTGFHAGKERIPVELKPGRNVIAVEIAAGNAFFLSVTDKLIWEEDLR